MESDNDDKYRIGKKTQKLAELNLALSAHSINGWFGNFERVKRFYKLYLEEKDGTQKLDFALSFFIFSYHLRDWIQIYEQIDKLEYDKKWSKFVNDYPDIKISRDICNVSKHLKISQEGRDKNFPDLFWEYDSFVTKSNDWLAEIGAEAGKTYSHRRDEAHLFNHGYAYWLATGDPRAAILQAGDHGLCACQQLSPQPGSLRAALRLSTDDAEPVYGDVEAARHRRQRHLRSRQYLLAQSARGKDEYGPVGRMEDATRTHGRGA